MVGSIVEYYDFGIYAVFAPIIGSVFFDVSSSFLRLMLAFSIFAVGFLMRPLGGIIFGHIGDKFGRKIALNISILGMAGATLIVGFLPGYQSIGIFAPIILLIVRMIQGLCIGGEGAGSAIFMLEHLAKDRLYFVGTVVMGSNMFGTLLSVMVGMMISHLFGFDTYHWRLAFIIGSVVGMIGSYYRRNCQETPVFQEIKSKNKVLKRPFVTVIKERGKALFLVVALAGASTSVAYMVRGYLTAFFLEIMDYSIDQAFEFTAACLIVLIALLPIFGILSSRVGYSFFLKIVAVLVILLAYPTFLLLANPQKSVALVYLGLLILSILGAGISAPAYPYVIQAFPPELRYSGVALGWNLGNAFFGGTTPFFSTMIVEYISPLAPAYYLMATSFMFLVVSQILQQYSYETLRKKVMKKRKTINNDVGY